MPVALTCPWCGAPLPRIAPGERLVVCPYCGSTSSLDGTRAAKAPAPSAGAPPPARPAAADPRLVVEAFSAARARGASPFEALVVAARERLGPLGETEAFARVVHALASELDAEHGTKTVEDALCMDRLITVYLKAIEGVRARGSYDVHIPFFAAGPNGPVHLSRTLTAEAITALARNEPNPRKKARFWPFG